MEHRALKIRVGDLELCADAWAGGDEAHVLLLHGLGGNSITWHGVAPRLAQALKAQVLALDLPGFGASRPGPEFVSIERLAALVLEVLTRRAPSNVRWQLAGNSLGGLLALKLACEAPGRIDRITLAAPALPIAWGRSPRELVALLSYLPAAIPWLGRRIVTHYVQKTGVPAVVDDPVRLLFHDSSLLDSTLRQRLIDVSEYRLTWAEDAARALEQATLSLALALLDSGRAAYWIRQAPCPVRTIYGGRDPLYPNRAWRSLEWTRPDWSYICMPDVGHVPQLEAPATFAEHMLRPW